MGKQVTLDSVLSKITPKATEYIVYIHSPGGDVFEGFAIYNALKNTGKEIEVRIVGQCASIATSIASAASPGRLFMNEKGTFMIHNPRFMEISGESKDLRNAADLLDQIKSQFLKEWKVRTGLSDEQLSGMYDTATYLTPEEAKNMGFVDEVKPEMKAVAKADFKKYQHMNDKNKIVAWANDFLKKVIGLNEPKAEAVDTLADGTKIVVQTDDGDWTGKQITYEDGSPVPPGTYELSGGRTLTVGDDSTATENPKEAEAKKEEESPENDMKLKEENEALKAKIAELESALEARTTTEAKLNAKASDLETKLNVQVKALSEELKKFKETTVGDQTPPPKAIKTTPDGQAADPLQKLFGQYIIDPRK